MSPVRIKCFEIYQSPVWSTFFALASAANAFVIAVTPQYVGNVQAPVKSAGVTVGRIASITFDNKTFQALVTLEIDRKYEFPADSSAKVLTSGLLGDKYIGLEAGGDEKNIQAGESIKMTQSAIVLENLIGQFLYNKAGESPKDGTAKK